MSAPLLKSFRVALRELVAYLPRLSDLQRSGLEKYTGMRIVEHQHASVPCAQLNYLHETISPEAHTLILLLLPTFL